MDPSKNSGICRIEGCGRHVRARRLCQSHYKHMRRFGKVLTIQPKREGRPNTVRYGGMSLTADCAHALDVLAKRLGMTANALITDIVESWAYRHMPPAVEGRPKPEAGQGPGSKSGKGRGSRGERGGGPS